MHKAVFLDRDGVINVDHGYVGKIEDFEFLPHVKEALAFLKAQQWKLILVTNQSGIARGMYSEQDFHKLTDFMQGELSKVNAQFDGVYFCPHHKEAQVAEYRQDCSCRKPKPGMLLKAAQELDIDLGLSIMVGDHASDIKAAKAAGISKLVLVGTHISTESSKVPEAQVFTDLYDFVQHYF